MDRQKMLRITSSICCVCGPLVLILAVSPAEKARAGMLDGPVPGLSLVQEAGAGKLGILENVLNGLSIPRQTGEEFNRILLRNRTEMEAVLSENPFLIWDTMSVVLSAMPYLKEIEQNGGRLYLDRDTYSSTVNLLEKYQAVASPKLAADLQLLRTMFDRRIKTMDSEGLWIDLN
jgi:hypothetical protein